MKEVDRVAAAIFDHVHPPATRGKWTKPFEQQEPPCKAFYRNLARWHLRELAVAVQPTIPFDPCPAD